MLSHHPARAPAPDWLTTPAPTPSVPDWLAAASWPVLPVRYCRMVLRERLGEAVKTHTVGLLLVGDGQLVPDVAACEAGLVVRVEQDFQRDGLVHAGGMRMG